MKRKVAVVKYEDKFHWVGCTDDIQAADETYKLFSRLGEVEGRISPERDQVDFYLRPNPEIMKGLECLY